MSSTDIEMLVSGRIMQIIVFACRFFDTPSCILYTCVTSKKNSRGGGNCNVYNLR